jgi:anti-sigma B factor antagonist
VDSAPPLFELVESRHAGRVRLLARGELDIGTVDQLGERLKQLRGRREAVLLDLDALDFIDASGLHLILTAVGDARDDGWALAVTRGSAAVRRLVELLELDGRLPYEENDS